MRFVQLEPNEFREFSEKSPYKSFMQTPEIAQYREENGWTSYYLGVKNSQNQILAASMLVAKPTFLGKSTFLVPGGPLLDLSDEQLTSFFFRSLKHYIKTHNGFVLHVSPYYELVQRDRYGKVVESGFNHQSALKNLYKLGFTPIESTQPKYMFVNEINGRTPDELFADFKSNTRNYIRRAEKRNVTVRELNREELTHFKTITTSTATRRDFTDQPLSYYQQMYDIFHPRDEVKFLLAEAEIDGKITDLSVAMFMTYGDEVVYLFSGSDEKYMRDYNAQYVIQWYMLKYAAEHHFQRYNFYGINGLPDPDSKDYGIYGFKKGFGGHVVELIGSFELPTNYTFFSLYKLLSRLKQKFQNQSTLKKSQHE